MKFLALQTDIDALRRQFIAEGEHEILTVARHPITFIVAFIVDTILYATAAFLIATSAAFITDTAGRTTVTVLFSICTLVYLYELLKAYIGWRHNYLIVTSEKIITIEHRSFLHQKVNSIHFNIIVRSHFDSQYFGILRCGTVKINLDEKLAGSARVITLRSIPAADTVVSAIENAMALHQQIAKGKDTPRQEESKTEAIKENLKEQVADAATEVIVPEERKK